jgi:alkaline phosphatase D
MLRALLLVTLCASGALAQDVQRIAFGSCHDQRLPAPVFATLADWQPDVFVMLGDNVYADTDDPQRIAECWAALDARPDFARLKGETRFLATWDDHDYGRDDAGAEYPVRADSQARFLDFLGVPRLDARREREGVYHAEVLGTEGRRVQVILLDTRYHRSPLALHAGERPNDRTGRYAATEDPGATVLGEAQWSWLEEQLQRPAELRLIASSIQLLSDEHGWETWGNFPAERERLMALIARTGAEGVVFLSGDRHSAEFSVQPPVHDGRQPGYPLFDLTSSSLNKPRAWRSERNPWRLGDQVFEENFGTIEIDWSVEPPELRFGIRAADGTPRLLHELSLDRLRAPDLRGPEPRSMGSEPLRRLAFGSCNNQRRPTPLWRNVLDFDPQAFVFLGDNVYADTGDAGERRAAYAQLAAQAGYAELAAKVPVLATWDDHDYAWNDLGGSAPPEVKADSQRQLLEFFREPADSPRWKRSGVYGSWAWGPADRRVQLILLDLRTERSDWAPRTEPRVPAAGLPGSYGLTRGDGVRMLGEAQWSWLEEQLRTPARLRLIGSSLQVGSDGHAWECWMRMPDEFQRLCATLRATRANGVVFLSGDTHWGELSRIEPWESGVPYPLYDVTSSGLNQAWEWTNMNNSRREGLPLWQPNWGSVEIDWDAPEPRVRFAVAPERGVPLRLELQLDELRWPAR